MRFLDVSKFGTLIPLSLLISCKPSFPIGGLKMFSLPTLEMKPPTKIVIWYIGNLLKKEPGRQLVLQFLFLKRETITLKVSPTHH
jgi:hypothetical protein